MARGILEIRLSALKRNFKILRGLCRKGAFFCPMVKDDAYGHGAERALKALAKSGAGHAGVLSLSEAERLLHSGVKAQILIFGPLLERAAWRRISWQRRFLTPVISNFKDLAEASRLKGRLNIHLKFDLGFSRLGFAFEDRAKIRSVLDSRPHLHAQGVCSQPPQKGPIEGSAALKKLKGLQKLFRAPCLHCLNTEALLSQKTKTALGARPGIGLYGSPAPPQAKRLKQKGLELLNVSTLKGFIVNVRHIKKGARVSYAGEWQARRDSVIATVSLGYADGVPFSWSGRRQDSRPSRESRKSGTGASEGACVLYRGQKAPIAGRVTMDFFMIDVTDIVQKGPAAFVGEEAALFGSQGLAFLSPWVQAQKAGGAPPHVLFSSLGRRIKRVYVE